MKKTVLLMLGLLAMIAVSGNENDENSIRETIQSAYATAYTTGKASTKLSKVLIPLSSR